MFYESYPRLFEMFSEVKEMLVTASVMVNQTSPDFGAYLAATSRYTGLMMSLAVNLQPHPEWAGEIEGQIPCGCMAFKAPVVEKFLQEKGAKML